MVSSTITAEALLEGEAYTYSVAAVGFPIKFHKNIVENCVWITIKSGSLLQFT
jgi:hypothetical protein